MVGNTAITSPLQITLGAITLNILQAMLGLPVAGGGGMGEGTSLLAPQQFAPTGYYPPQQFAQQPQGFAQQEGYNAAPPQYFAPPPQQQQQQVVDKAEKAAP